MTVQEGKVVASAWLDRKVVMVMSTNTHQYPLGQCTVGRKMDPGKKSHAQKPSSATTNTWEVWTEGINSGATTGVG